MKRLLLAFVLLASCAPALSAQTGGATQINHGTLAQRPVTCKTARGEVYFQTDAAGAGPGLDLCPDDAWARAGSDQFAQGTFAARPAASAPNKSHFYFATDTNGGTLYVSTGSAWVKVGLGLTEVAGVTDHGALTGLSDDDHTQYHTDARADLRYVPLARQINGHALTANVTVTPDDIGLGSVDNTSDASKPVSTAQQAALDVKADAAALTSEASTRAAADTALQTNIDAEASARASAITSASTADRARSNHTGTQPLSTISDAGTAAALNVPSSGNAASSEVVKGNDTRLADSRTPTAHASSHASAGSDPLTLAQSQITNLVSDLAGKQAALGFTPVPNTRTVNGHALSADVSVDKTDVGLSAVTNDAQTKAAVVPNTLPSAGQIPVGNAGGTAYAPQSVSGDVTITSAGVTAIGAGKVTNSMLAGSIDLTAKVTGALPVGNGGTGQTSYTNGQLLIGNTTGNTLAKATLTPGSNISITNGAGSVTIAATVGGVAGWTDGTTRTVGVGSTQYMYLLGPGSTFNSTESNRQNVIPDGFTVSKLYIRTSATQPSDGALVCTVRDNSADTSVVVTVTANAVAGTFSDTSNSASIAAGHLVSLKCVNASASTSAGIIDVRLVMVRN